MEWPIHDSRQLTLNYEAYKCRGAEKRLEHINRKLVYEQRAVHIDTEVDYKHIDVHVSSRTSAQAEVPRYSAVGSCHIIHVNFGEIVIGRAEMHHDV